MDEIADTATRLRTVFRLLLRRAEALSGADSPTRSEQGVLSRLDEQGEMTPSALSSAQQVRPQSMAQTLDSLERRRWVRKTRDAKDRRQIFISLTPSGQKALTKGRKLRQAWLVSELKKLSPHDRKTLSSALGILENFLTN
jgi:DNA-binding MarR family transcriptional regulator